MKSIIESLSNIKRKNFAKENVNIEKQFDQAATVVFDRSIESKSERFLDNHLNSAKAGVKFIEISPKLR